MICQKCHMKQASVYVTQLINGNKAELYLCERCARESGALPSGSPLNMSDFFAGLIGLAGKQAFVTGDQVDTDSQDGKNSQDGQHGQNDQSGQSSQSEQSGQGSQTVPGKVCEKCGMSFVDFQKNGKMGCGNCYEVFGDSMRNLLKRLHGSVLHTGKVPAAMKEKLKVSREIDSLKSLLGKAIQTEEYERAAELRDKIRELEVTQ